MKPGQIKYTRGLLRSLKFDEQDKENLCLIHSNGRTAHLSEMDHDETVSLQTALKEALVLPVKTGRDKMQSKIISLAHELGWHIPGTHKVDMELVNNWCLQKSGFLKPLRELNYIELPKAVTMFSSMHAAYLKAF